ncbi:MAG: carboxypeptidase M32, partial [candidate division Zixibacteria bacterium]|nr:carboxypeptidase M32 [candidate division Zixibacteria bacterium]NIS45940.1 carboxypeptidase M32 [candidate division Zixibacteria bacterium]NIU14072.1 carboxypeptidase M32 [candidate division Zixibacteria bacterium]NIV06105.1 carboxypeptidase M32 [candidate division Zixibacteria bacterium]NIW44889.1 carboxypeptidase M32 [Gammaproteobacteria bacterium]
MEEKLSQLKKIAAEAIDLRSSAYVLNWDQQVNMPEGGAEARAHQLALLLRLAHEKRTSPEVGELLEELTPYAQEELDPDSDDARLIKVTKRLYERDTKIPPDFIAERAKTV